MRNHNVQMIRPTIGALFLCSTIECSNSNSNSNNAFDRFRLVETQKLTTDDWNNYVPSSLDTHGEDDFGGTVVLHGDTAAVHLIRGQDWYSGDVFVMTKSEDQKWVSQGIVKAWDGDEYDLFGDSIAIYEDTLLVGSPYDDYYSNERIGDPGAVYVFTRSFITTPDGNNKGIWNAHTKLQPNDAPTSSSSNYSFGDTVAIVKDTIAVGATQRNTYKAVQGSVYIFSKQPPSGSWTQVAKYAAWDDETGNHFGTSLALTKDLLVVGASSGKSDGAVYVFYKNNNDNSDWSQGVKFQGITPTATATTADARAHPSDVWAQFGMSVAAAGNTVVVGAPGTNHQKGAVYVYTRDSGSNSWRRTVLEAEDAIEKDYFGLDVDISPDESTITVGVGVTYVSKHGRCFCDRFRRTSSSSGSSGDDGWTFLERIVPSDAAPYTEYGRSFAMGQDMLMVGSGGHSRSGNEEAGRGAVYVFEQRGKTPRPRPPIPTADEKKQAEPQQQSRWMNLVVSLLLLYVINRVFLRNG